VGQVCFHLAENKADQAYPFAFMATYSTGFGSGGRLKHLPLRKALEQYAGARDRSALIKLLSPVQQASSQVKWVNQLVESNDIYQPLAWTADMAYRFLKDVPELEVSGLTVRLPNWWKKRVRPAVSVTIGEKRKSKLGADAVLDFNVGVALGEEQLSPDEVEELLAGGDGLVLFKGQWIEIDSEKLKEAINHWEKLRSQARNGEVSFIEGMRMLAGASADLKHEEQADQETQWVYVSAGDSMREILAGLREPDRLDMVDAGTKLKATLRPYQREGLAWLYFLVELGLGACLADDMGLGKTIQTLALLLCCKNTIPKRTNKPSLLVIPASLLGNWRNEASRFTPSLKLTFLHPAETDRNRIDRIAECPEKMLAETDLAVTTYSMLTRQTWLRDVSWRLVILDEAQAIKNPSTRQAKSAKKLSAQARIVLTGTPVENRIGDLWSLFDFLNPGLLGSATVFKTFIKTLQAREHDRFAPLRRLVGPYILRRMKTDRNIIADLPEKTEVSSYCRLSKSQIILYENTVQALKTTLETADGMARRGAVLQSLMRLKQICNHPSQLNGDGRYAPVDSGKFIRVREICEEIASRQEKALVFTQFREITEPLADYLAVVFGRTGLILHGGTQVRKRKKLIEQFQSDDGPPFFILSLKAGGTGLNLTAASHIIHFDRWWNPAVENQATDRAFRIGQKRNVLVHKFVTTGTVEERIDALISEKQKMADGILASNSEENLTELPDDEILRLVRLDVTRAQL
jgi:non-specific serine/threonine protein kinase